MVLKGSTKIFTTSEQQLQEVSDSLDRQGFETVAIDALYSPLFYRLLLKHQPLTDKSVDELVDLVMKGIAKT